MDDAPRVGKKALAMIAGLLILVGAGCQPADSTTSKESGVQPTSRAQTYLAENGRVCSPGKNALAYFRDSGSPRIQRAFLDTLEKQLDARVVEGWSIQELCIKYDLNRVPWSPYYVLIRDRKTTDPRETKPEKDYPKEAILFNGTVESSIVPVYEGIGSLLTFVNDRGDYDGVELTTFLETDTIHLRRIVQMQIDQKALHLKNCVNQTCKTTELN